MDPAPGHPGEDDGQGQVRHRHLRPRHGLCQGGLPAHAGGRQAHSGGRQRRPEGEGLSQDGDHARPGRGRGDVVRVGGEGTRRAQGDLGPRPERQRQHRVDLPGLRSEGGRPQRRRGVAQCRRRQGGSRPGRAPTHRHLYDRLRRPHADGADELRRALRGRGLRSLHGQSVPDHGGGPPREGAQGGSTSTISAAASGAGSSPT